MPKKVCLVDGSGYIFRAFYALPPMTNPAGLPVNAVYGFTNMFLKLTSQIKCDYSLVLFDAKRKNFRNEIFPDYKGTRKEIPEDLIPQFELIHNAVSALNLNYLEMDGFEADDLIATYAAEALKKGYEVVIVSGDKDLMQLIRPGVEFYDPMKDKFFTPEDVKEKFGVYPEQVADVQALSGDSIDNVPGVPGIGPKTAAELVNQFGSLEGVLEHAGEIKQNKRRETLLANLDNARISKQLVQLKNDVPVEHDLEEYGCRNPELTTLLHFVDEHGFKSLKPRLEKWVSEQCADPLNPQAKNVLKKEVQKKYELIADEAGLKRWVEKISKAGLFSFRTVSNGSEPVFDRISGLAMAINPGEACYVPLGSAEVQAGSNFDLFAAPQKSEQRLSREQAAKWLKSVFTDRSILKIGHAMKLDLHFMSQIFGTETAIEPIDDIAVISYDLDSTEHSHGIDELAELFLDYKAQKLEDLLGSGKNKISVENLDNKQLLDFAAEQADLILRLYNVLKPRLVPERKAAVYENFDRPLIGTLKEMEQNGIMVDAGALRKLSSCFEEQLRQIESQVYELAGEEFNLGSPKQIGEILYTKLGLKGKKTASGSFQTGADVLEKMAEEHELPAKILEWRGFAKLKSTYTEALLNLLDANSRIHTTYNQINTTTGRLSSTNPNLQNIPIRTDMGLKIRECFIAKPGHKIISSDYSQVELRLMAVVAGVKALKEAFNHGIDIHAATAAKVFGVPADQVDHNLRRHAKTINFGVIYGISQYGLAKQLGISADEAKIYIDNYFRQMPEIKAYMEKTIAFAHKNGFVLTPYGRKCFVFGINDKNKRISSNAERAAINAPLQGGAADIIKMAMNQCLWRLQKGGFKTKMLLQVHDELVFEAPDNEVEAIKQLVKETMENVVHFDIPFIAETGSGQNWAEAH